jgi:hypothetical protein
MGESASRGSINRAASGGIDRAALERIIRRAAELQTSEREVAEHLSPEQVMALGQEVGIPRRYLQQALLEEGARLPDQPANDLLTQVAGPGVVQSHRVMRTDPALLEQRLLEWMDQQELLCVQRRQPGRITWEPLSGFQAAIRRSTAAFGGGRKPMMLSRASTVTATFTPLEEDWCHVLLQADVRSARGAYIGGAATAAAGGALASAALVALSAMMPLALLPIPLGAGVGWTTLRRFRPVPARVLLGLERALDELEQGAVKPGHRLPERTPRLLDVIADEIRRSLRP